MSPRSRFASLSRLVSLALALAVATSCTTGGPILTEASPLASPTPTGSATPTPTPTPAATPTPSATPTPDVSPTPTPTPNPDGSFTLLEGSISLQGGFVVIFNTFTLSTAGSLNFVADWTSAQNDIDIALAAGTCTSAQLNLGQCTFAGLEESPTLKPETMTLALAAGSYTPLIGNFSSPTETITYRLTFLPSAAAARAGSAAVVPPAPPVPMVVRMPGKLRP